MFENIKADIARYNTMRPRERLIYLLFAQEFHALLIYRFGKFTAKIKMPVAGFVLRKIYFVLNKVVAEMMAGIYLNISSELGKGFQFGHFGGIYIIAKLGENCTVAQQVTLGYKGAFSGGGVPRVGNNVYIGAGAKVFGDIVIGDNVRIGANAVVLDDVPDNATVVGIPARVVKIRPHG